MNTALFAEQHKSFATIADLALTRLQAQADFAFQAAADATRAFLAQGQALVAAKSPEAVQSILVDGLRQPREQLDQVVQSGQEVFAGHLRAAGSIAELTKANFEQATAEATTSPRARKSR